MKLSYRADIDGLRAIAVGAVVAFHAAPEWMKGGFVGVDIFFVISGFLISSIIIDQANTNTFRLSGFYSRRIKRIFPSLILVLVASLFLGLHFQLPDEFRNLGKHVSAGIASVANILLWKESNYFDEASNLKPLLHLWSLGIEEQFYIFWPLLLAFLVRRKLSLKASILSLALASFVANIFSVHDHAAATFYLPFTRLWELLIGCFLATCLVPRSRAQSNVCAWIGIALITFAVVALDESKVFPGWWALAPTIGTALIIYTGPRAWFNQHVLSCRPFVAIGLISYPLYLWHWPLLSFLYIMHGGDAPALEVRLAAIALSFILAWMSYVYFEKSLRGGRLKKFNTTRILSYAGLVIFILGILVSKRIILPDSAKLDVKKALNAYQRWDFPGKLLPFFDGSEKMYRLGEYPEEVLFMGDSNLQQYAPRITKMISESPESYKSAIFASHGGCLPIPGIITKNSLDCANFVQHVVAFVKNRPQIKDVVLAAQWHGAFSKATRHQIEVENSALRLDDPRAIKAALESLKRMVISLQNSKKYIHLVLGIPTGNFFNPKSMAQRRTLSQDWRINLSLVHRSDWISDVPKGAGDLKQMAEQLNINIIDPVDTICPGEVCNTIDQEGNFVYKDRSHLTPEFVENHVMFFDEIMKRKP